jgi:hypothetical protein
MTPNVRACRHALHCAVSSKVPQFGTCGTCGHVRDTLWNTHMRDPTFAWFDQKRKSRWFWVGASTLPLLPVKHPAIIGACYPVKKRALAKKMHYTLSTSKSTCNSHNRRITMDERSIDCAEVTASKLFSAITIKISHVFNYHFYVELKFRQYTNSYVVSEKRDKEH